MLNYDSFTVSQVPSGKVGEVKVWGDAAVSLGSADPTLGFLSKLCFVKAACFLFLPFLVSAYFSPG